jgi:hypothetical protein
MNVDELQRKLIAVARAHPPSERVPYAFEKRVLARLTSSPRTDEWGLWARALWRATAPCVAIMLLLGAWSIFSPPPAKAPASDLAQAIDNTILAAVDQEPPPVDVVR